MDRMDDVLEAYLRRLDAGEPPERVIASLAPDEAELAPLLRTAVRARSAQHPRMNPLKVSVQRGQVARASRGNDGGKREAWSWSLVPAGVIGLGAIAFLVVLAAVLAFGAPGSARAATLRDVSGVVEVSSAADAEDWRIASEGQRIGEGEVVRTRFDSSATLVFYEGSRTTVESESAVLVEKLSGSWDRALKLQLRQLYGETSHQVVRLQGSGAFFKVVTPAGLAEVKGTAFHVNVNTADGVFFEVDHGRVAVSQVGQTVFLTAGQATLVEPESSPDEPAYAFFVQGPIQSIDGENWVVAGTAIQVNPTLGAGFVVGDIVAVRGRILEDGSYVADRVTYAKNDQTKLRFTGVIQSMGDSEWVIGGKTVKVDGETEYDGDLEVGDTVSVTYVVLENGDWLAKEIEALEEDDAVKTPTPSPTAEETETVEVTATPDLTLTLTPEVTATPEPTFEGNRSGCEGGSWQHPEGVRLAARWGVSYAEIMSWFCQGYGFGEIDLAYELARSSGKPVTEIFAMRASGMGWGNVKKGVEPVVTDSPKPTKAPKPTKQPNPNKGPKNKP